MKNNIYLVSLLFLAIFCAVLYTTIQFIQPSPKKEITIATGAKSGNYYQTALLYKELLKEDKVEVNILETAGSVENLELVKQGKTDIAFMQNGIIENNTYEHIQSLASVYYEPLWVFYKNESYSIDYVIELISKKISIGPEGSGTKDLASKILEVNGINSENSTIYNYSSSKAKEELENGNIDALFVVSSHNSTIVKELLENPKINVLSFKRAKAYSRKYSFLEALTLYEGTLDLYKNLPDQNINLLSTTATLIANQNLNEELIRLFLKKVKEVHSKKDLFAKPNQFPNTNNMMLELNEEASRYFTYGDTWLEKIFPFWIASNIDRLKILIIPLLTLLIPLSKGIFPLYRWSIRSKIYKWYKQIQLYDLKLENVKSEELESFIKELEELRQEIKFETKVPLAFMSEYYDLIMHLELIINKANQKRI